MFKRKKNDKPKIDETKLSQEELEGSGFHIRKGLLIFCLILLAIIIVLSVIVVRLK